MRNGRFSVANFFIALLLALLALLSALLAASGAGVFRATVEGGEDRSSVRTAMAYVENKLRAAGQQALLLEQGEVLCLPLEDEAVATYIYEQDGYLMEYYAPLERGLDRALGERLLPLGGFSLEQEGDLLTVTVRAGDAELQKSILVTSPGGEGA